MPGIKGSGGYRWQNFAHIASVVELAGYGHKIQPKFRCKEHEDTTKAKVYGISDSEILSIEEAVISLECLVGLPSVENLVDILQKCRKSRSWAYVRRVVMHIHDNGLEADGVIGNHLVPLLVECGSVAEAQQVFYRLMYRNEYSWTSLIQGYIACGESHHALDLFQKMQEDNVHSSRHTVVAVLKACARLKLVDRGQGMHSEIAKEGFETDPCIGSVLVDMYAKCGLLSEAQEVFDDLPAKDVITWTALIAGYAEHGLGEDAVQCLKQMQVDGLCLDAGIFVCCLKGCVSLGTLGRGQEIHAEIAKEGFDSDLIVGNSLVDMYVKSGSLIEAHAVFEEMQVRDVISWTALISGYAEHGCGEEALTCLEKMQQEGVPPNDVTLICSLRACGSIETVKKGQEIHAMIVRGGLERGPFIGSALVDMYGKCQLFSEALGVLYKLEVKDAISWNALIAGYADHGLAEEAMNVFEMMQLEGISPDDVTFVCTLKACCGNKAIDSVRELHKEIVKKGYENDLCVGNALVDSYVKCGSVAEAQDVFDGLQIRDIVSWTALIAGYAFRGKSEIVFHLFEKMREQGIRPDGIALLSVLTVCSHAGLVGKGHNYFEAISQKYGMTPTIRHHNTMVDLLGRAGQLDEAVAMLEKMPFQPDLVTWLSVLGACRKWGNVELGEKAFEYVVRLDKRHDAAFFLMSNIYLDAHMWEDARRIEMMQTKTEE